MEPSQQFDPRLVLYRVIPFGCYDPNKRRVDTHAFLPFRDEDDHQLSVSDSRLIAAKELYRRYSADPEREPPDGIMAVTPEDCQEKCLPVKSDSQPVAPDHVLIDFVSYSRYLRTERERRLSICVTRQRSERCLPSCDAEVGTVGARVSDAAWSGGLWDDQDSKLRRPKEAFHAALHASGVARIASLYQQLAERVSLNRCGDRSFHDLRAILREWFPRQRTEGT